MTRLPAGPPRSDDARVNPAPPLLPAIERGFVLGVALAGGSPATAARLAGDGGERCRLALEALDAATDEARAATTARWAAAARAAVPEGIEHLHPGWIRRLLADEPASIVRAVVAGLPAAVIAVAAEILIGRGEDPAAPPPAMPAATVETLRRALFASVEPMPGAGEDPGARAPALSELPFAELLEALDGRGARLLGTSLQGAPAATIAQAAAGVGAPLARAVLDAAQAAAPSAGARAGARALVARASDMAGHLGAARAIGLRALAEELGRERAAAGVVAAIAQRLPPVLGEALTAIASGPAPAGEGEG
jgi:hypothetical protein